MQNVMDLIKSMLTPNKDGVYSIVEAKAKTGFICYDINLSLLDVKAINDCLEANGFTELQASHFKPEKYGDNHRLFVGKKPQRKEADVSTYFA
tara:strand:- start:27 stop:305 length:279 start_codon:yes stop_codon:yes gene_type:complete